MKAVAVAVAALVGIGIGYGAGSEPAEAEIREVEVVEEVETEVTPEVCLEAIEEAREGFTVASEYAPLVAKAFNAGLYDDVGEARGVIATQKALLRRLKANDFRSLSSQCEEAAG